MFAIHFLQCQTVIWYTSLVTCNETAFPKKKDCKYEHLNVNTYSASLTCKYLRRNNRNHNQADASGNYLYLNPSGHSGIIKGLWKRQLNHQNYYFINKIMTTMNRLGMEQNLAWYTPSIKAVIGFIRQWLKQLAGKIGKFES